MVVVLTYLLDVLFEDTKHLVQLQLLPPLDGQLFDLVASLQERLESGLWASSLLPAKQLLQPLAQLLQSRQLEREERTVSFSRGGKLRFVGRENTDAQCAEIQVKVLTACRSQTVFIIIGRDHNFCCCL